MYDPSGAPGGGPAGGGIKEPSVPGGGPAGGGITYEGSYTGACWVCGAGRAEGVTPNLAWMRASTSHWLSARSRPETSAAFGWKPTV